MPTVIRKSPGPLPDSAVASAEQTLGVQFPPDYRAFLLQFNGGRPKPDGIKIHWQPGQVCGQDWGTTAMSWFYEITDNDASNLLKINRVDLAGRLPPGTLAIAGDAGGNELLLAVDGPHQGKILLWIKVHEAVDGETPGYDNVGFVADSFTDFIQNRLTDKP